MLCSDLDYASLRQQILDRAKTRQDSSASRLFGSRQRTPAWKIGSSESADLVVRVRNESRTHLQRSVSEAVALHETSFFRDAAPFEVLRKRVLPELIAENRQQRKLRLWSAACSTGQEAYSLAILLLEHYPELESWDVKIFGTDLSQSAIEVAAKGRYSNTEVQRGLTPSLLDKYFLHEGEEWVVAPQVRSLCEFHAASLCGPQPVPLLLDAVLMRNVLLYLSKEVRGCVFATVWQHMSARGFLLLGNAVQAEDSTNLFEPELAADTALYRPSVRL
jgi:chemotaxis protein methyltransferase CheR